MYTWGGNRRQTRKSLKVTGVIALAALVPIVIFTALFVINNDTEKNASETPEAAVSQPQKVRVEGRYLFTGTTVWGRHMLTWSERADGSMDYTYPFSGLDTFERGKYDAWMTELECPAIKDGMPVKQQIANISFNCPPEFLPEAAKYFDFISLANNHSFDLGQERLDETRRTLSEHGLQHFGDFEPAKRDNICEVVALPVRIISEQNGEESSKNAHLPAAMCAWHYFFRLPSAGEIEVMREYAEVMPVFAFLHAGTEYQPEANETQVSMARRIADQNPVFVLANNPHWVQNGEVYNNIPILYSTGNFIFDQQWHPELMRSANLDAHMSIPYSDELQRLLDIGASCQAYKDNCLQQIKQGNYAYPEPSFTYDIVAGDSSGQLTKRADSALQQAVEERVRWPVMHAALGQE